MNALKWNYIFFFAYVGLYCNLFSKHLHAIYLTGQQIGIIFTIIPLSAFFSNQFWGWFSDKYKTRNSINILLPLCGCISTLICLSIDNYQSYLALSVFIGVFINPLFAITDSITIVYCETHQKHFGEFRHWGTSAFCIINFLMMALFLSYEFTDYFLLFLLPFFLLLRVFSAIKTPNVNHKGKVPSFRDFLKVLRQGPMLLFFFCSMLHSMSFVANYVYFSPFMQAKGSPDWFISLCWAISPLFEICVFKYSKKILTSFDCGSLFRFSLIVTSLRWVLLTFLIDDNMILLTQILHTFGFGTFILAQIEVLTKNIPKCLRSSGQGFFTAFGSLLALVISNQILGWVAERNPLPYVFLYASGFSFLAWATSLFLSKEIWTGLNSENPDLGS